MGIVGTGRYALVDPLAEGGSGAVWRAWDSRDERFVAVKMLKHVDAASLVRFVREQSARFDHPNILAPTGWYGDDEHVLLVMPLVDGGSLHTLIGEYGVLPTPWAARVLEQLLLALASVHGAGVVHRDVKPANILLEATGRGEPVSRLSDFGLAVHADEARLTSTNIVLGTPGYLAPERMLSAAADTPAVDVYSAGVAALEMAAGKRLRDAGAVLESLADIDPEFRAVIEPMVDIDAARRPGDATAALLLLDASGLATRPLGADVDIRPHLPELPEGWTDDGPHTGVHTVVAPFPTSTSPDDPTATATPGTRAALDDRAALLDEDGLEPTVGMVPPGGTWPGTTAAAPPRGPGPSTVPPASAAGSAPGADAARRDPSAHGDLAASGAPGAHVFSAFAAVPPLPDAPRDAHPNRPPHTDGAPFQAAPFQAPPFQAAPFQAPSYAAGEPQRHGGATTPPPTLHASVPAQPQAFAPTGATGTAFGAPNPYVNPTGPQPNRLDGSAPIVTDPTVRFAPDGSGHDLAAAGARRRSTLGIVLASSSIVLGVGCLVTAAVLWTGAGL